MPRGPRVIYKNAFLNVTSRGNNKRIIFRKNKDYIYFRNLLVKYKRIYKFEIHHYSFMRNHIHLLLKVIDPISFPKAMQGIQLSYFHYFRKKYGYVGRFWQGRYHSKIIKDDKYLLTAGLYIEANSVRAGLTESPTEHKWSSYNFYATGIKDLLIDFDPYYLDLSNNDEERQRIYGRTMKDYLKTHLENDSL